MDMQSILMGEGIPLMAVGMTVVFISLVVLMLMMMGLKRVMALLQKPPKRAESRPVSHDEVTGEIIAAIAITLILEDEQSHDDESLVLTMRGMPKPFNTWWVRGMQEPTPKHGLTFRPLVDKTSDTV